MKYASEKTLFPLNMRRVITTSPFYVHEFYFLIILPHYMFQCRSFLSALAALERVQPRLSIHLQVSRCQQTKF